MHLDFDLPIALAGFATASADVEAESPGTVSVRFAFLRAREQRADIVPQPDIGCGIASGGSSDRALIDVDHLIDVLDAGDLTIGARAPMRMVDAIRQRRSERVGDQRAFAASGNARDDRKRAEGDGERDVVQVVLACSGELEAAALGFATLLRHRDHATTRKVIGRKRTFRGRNLLRRSGSDDHTATLTSTRAHVHHIICGANGVLVMLDHDHGVAKIAQMFERSDKTLVVTLMQADGGLVKDIEHAHQTRADLRGQTDTLRFATGKGCGRTL